MRRLPLDINDSVLGNIKYRNNVVTGEVATVNGNGTYDVYISGCDVAYPNIPTTLRNPNFSVEDAVEVLIEYGNKELPIIIGLSKKIVQDIIQIDMNVIVTTLDAYSITSSSAYLELRIEDIEGYENCTRYGFYYGTSTGYGSDTYSTGSFGSGSYNKQVTGLTGETTYHFQAYVYDADGDEQTGEDKTLTTSIMGNIIAYIYYSGSSHYLAILDPDGNEIYNALHSAVAFSVNGDPIIVDIDRNIYIAGRYADQIKKLDDAGSWIYHYYHANPYHIAIAPNGDIWYYTYTTGPTYAPTLYKIDPNTLQVIDSFEAGVVGDFMGIAFGSDGYLYMINWAAERIEKWDVVNKTQIDYRDLPSGDLSDRAIYSSLAVVGSTVYLTQWANDEGDIFTCPTDLSSDFTANNVDDDFPAASDYCNFITACDGTHIVVEGYVSNVKTIVKYDTSFTRIWKITIDEAGSGLGVASYPF